MILESLVGRRFLMAILGLLSSFFCGLRGWQHLDHKRRFRGAAWLFVGILLGLGGMGLWWATGFRETWGWPI